MPTIFIYQKLLTFLRKVRRKIYPLILFRLMKHIQSRSLLLKDVQNSRMCLKTYFMQNNFSNTMKTSFFSSFLLNTCYFAVNYFNGKYVVFNEI